MKISEILIFENNYYQSSFNKLIKQLVGKLNNTILITFIKINDCNSEDNISF